MSSDTGIDSAVDVLSPSGSDAAVDAGPCMASQWRNHATNMCAACPAGSPTCTDIVPTDVQFNPANGRLRIPFRPGVAEFTSGEIRALVSRVGDGGMTQMGMSISGTIEGGDTIVFDLSPWLGADFIQARRFEIVMRDVCGRSTDVNFANNSEIAIQDGGMLTFALSCAN